jgi:hypothetical protein
MKNFTYFAVSALALNALVGCGDNSDGPIEFPRTCAEAAVGNASAKDGEYKLFIDNDETKPWTAWCDDLQGDNPKEYLTVESNRSTYASRTGEEVETRYEKIRIDPDTLELDTSDQTFAASTGSATHAPGVEVTSMPLGVAMSCGFNFAGAELNVNNTPFVIENRFAVRGDGPPVGSANPWSTNKVVEITSIGDCSWTAPETIGEYPMNEQGGYMIRLVYSK